MGIWSNLRQLKHWTRSLGVTVALSVSTIGVCQNQPALSLDVTPVFEATRLPQGNITVIVTASNKGPDAQGSINVNSQRGKIIVPMDLPQGSQKKVTVSFTCVPYEALPDVQLVTNKGTISMPVKAEFQGGTFYALISESPGGLNFMRGKEGTQQSYQGENLTHDMYCRPKNAPDRAAAYQSVGAIILGEGSERLTNAQVEALKYYLLQGGRLVFTGGPASPVLSDVRWRGIVPAVPKGLETLDLRDDMIGEAVTSGRITLTQSSPIKGARVKLKFRGISVVTDKRFGLGRAVFLAFDPIEDPARNWKNINVFFNNQIGGKSAFDEVGLIATQQMSNPMNPMGSMSGMPSTTAAPETKSLFDVQMPAWHEVTGILLMFVLIVPLHLLLLRKFKKGELAWFTTPILSIIFAGVFFRYAGALYSVGQTYKVTGAIVTDSSLNDAYFSGQLQAFFPSGGDFRMGANEVEELSSIGNGGAVTSVDSGTLNTVLTSGNLTFHDLFYRQRLPNAGRLVVQRNGKKLLVKNLTPYSLSNLELYGSKWNATIGALKPGAQSESSVDIPEGIKEVTINAWITDGYALDNLGKNSSNEIRYLSTISL